MRAGQESEKDDIYECGVSESCDEEVGGGIYVRCLQRSAAAEKRLIPPTANTCTSTRTVVVSVKFYAGPANVGSKQFRSLYSY